jgi:hypothetical protein
MNTFIIKLIAITAMIIDHIGLFFFPHIFIFRVIGRLSFPLFAWLIANGATHTKNITGYAIRLLLLALISQIPFALANLQINTSPGELNVVFTLFLGLIAIIVMRKTPRKSFRLLAIIVAVVVSNVLSTDYGAAGILSIVSFYLFYNNFGKMLISQILILFIFPYLTLFLEYLYHVRLAIYYLDSSYEFFGIFSLFFIANYNKKLGWGIKYLFYLFYPLQYVLILLIKLFLPSK